MLSLRSLATRFVGRTTRRVTTRLGVTQLEDRTVPASLTLMGRSLGSQDLLVPNQKDVSLLRFNASATDGQDINLTALRFKTQNGNAADFQNYTLWVDTNGDGAVDSTLKKEVWPTGNQVEFVKLDDGGYVIPTERTVAFEVHGDVSSTPVGNTFQLQFSLGDPDFVQAHSVRSGSGLNGIDVNQMGTGEIVVFTTPSVLYNIQPQGDLYVTKDTVAVQNQQVLGGTFTNTLFRLNFFAYGEDVDVTKIHLAVVGAGASSIDRLELYKQSTTAPFPTTLFATATIGATGSDIVPQTYEGQAPRQQRDEAQAADGHGHARDCAQGVGQPGRGREVGNQWSRCGVASPAGPCTV